MFTLLLLIFQDRSFTFILKTPPASVLLLKAAGMINCLEVHIRSVALKFRSSTVSSIFLELIKTMCFYDVSNKFNTLSHL